MLLSRNKTNNVYPFKPQFYYIKVGFKVVNIIEACFRDGYIEKDPRIMYSGSENNKAKQVLS